jgi:hypothetical protein
MSEFKEREFGNDDFVVSWNEEWSAMSDLYEVGFVIDLRDDLSEEVRQTLEYMIGRGISGIQPSGFEHPLFHIEGYETAWASIIDSDREDDEEMLGDGCGSCLVDNCLVFRGLIHEDPFWNVWHELIDWLSLISVPSGVIGYDRNLYEEDEITFTEFAPTGVVSIEVTNYDDFEELQARIIEMLGNDGAC